MEINQAYIIYMIAEAVVFLIPLGTLIWKMAKLAAKVEQNEHRIDTLTDIVRKQDHSTEELMTEIKADLQSIKISIAKLETQNEDKERWKC